MGMIEEKNPSLSVPQRLTGFIGVVFACVIVSVVAPADVSAFVGVEYEAETVNISVAKRVHVNDVPNKELAFSLKHTRFKSATAIDRKGLFFFFVRRATGDKYAWGEMSGLLNLRNDGVGPAAGIQKRGARVPGEKADRRISVVDILIYEPLPGHRGATVGIDGHAGLYNLNSYQWPFQITQGRLGDIGGFFGGVSGAPIRDKKEKSGDNQRPREIGQRASVESDLFGDGYFKRFLIGFAVGGVICLLAVRFLD